MPEVLLWDPRELLFRDRELLRALLQEVLSTPDHLMIYLFWTFPVNGVTQRVIFVTDFFHPVESSLGSSALQNVSELHFFL